MVSFNKDWVISTSVIVAHKIFELVKITYKLLLNVIKKYSDVLMGAVVITIAIYISLVLSSDKNPFEEISAKGVFIAFWVFYLPALGVSVILYSIKTVISRAINPNRLIRKKLLEELEARKASAFISLEKRASGFIRMSYLVLFLILTVLTASSYFVIYAANIVRNDTTKVQLKSELESIIQTNVQILADNSRDIFNLNLEFKKINEVDNIESPDYNNAQIRMKKILETNEEILSSISDDTEQYKNIITDYYRLQLLDTTNTGIGEIANEELVRISAAREMMDNRETKLLITAWITRFGIVLLAVYLVQILITMYRFNTSSAAYYRSIADGILLEEIDVDKFNSIKYILTPMTEKLEVPSSILDIFSKSTDKLIDQFGNQTKQMMDTMNNFIGEKEKNEKSG